MVGKRVSVGGEASLYVSILTWNGIVADNLALSSTIGSAMTEWYACMPVRTLKRSFSPLDFLSFRYDASKLMCKVLPATT